MTIVGFILAIVFALAGIGMIINPEPFWAWDHMFSVKHGEPTEIALVLIRVRGVLFIILGIIAIYALIKVG